MTELTSARILFLDNFKGPGIGGGQVQLLHLARACVEAGMHVTVACQLNGPLPSRVRELGAVVEEIDFSPRDSVACVRRLGALARDAALVQGTGWYTNVLSRRIVGRSGAALVNVVHVEPGASLLDGGSRLGLAARRVVDMATSKRVDAYVAVSNAVSRGMAGSGIASERIEVISNGVDVEALAQAAREIPRPLALPAGNGPLVVCVARLEPVKGVEFFVRAAAMLADSHPQARFAIVGVGSQESRLREIAVAAGLQSRLAFLGDVARVEPLLAAATVVVMPSLSEALGLVALEAGALSRPVVASSVGGLVEVIDDGETGLLVPAADPSALAQAIGTLLAQPDLVRRLGAAARVRVSGHYTLERMIDGYMSLYKRLLLA
ncbi:MAG: glycosyltransferase family 4 protein [Actinobacteria bacterium]|nr:glycosyltransferase family 4 protein [Actinomycetota bacterium]